MEVEDRVDDETLESLRLIEECQAAAGELPDDFQGFSLSQAKAFDPEDDAPQQREDSGKTKLEAFPETIANQLQQRVKKYKDAAIARKQRFNAASERLVVEKASGHETFAGNNFYVYVLVPLF